MRGLVVIPAVALLIIITMAMFIFFSAMPLLIITPGIISVFLF